MARSAGAGTILLRNLALGAKTPWGKLAHFCRLSTHAERKNKSHHGARGAPNFGITLSANRRRLSREPWPNSRT